MIERKENQKPILIKNLNPDIYHQARLAALKIKQNIGTWITESIRQRIERENINKP